LPNKSIARPRSVARPRRRSSRARIGILTRCGIGVAVAFGLLVLGSIVALHLAPLTNTNRAHFDAIIVLGTPADADGNPTPAQLSAVTEAVREYERGVAPRLVITGGAAHNGYVEANVMARVARAEGLPPSTVLIEPRARNTMENACYSEQLLAASNWHSAEVVSSASHLARTALIFGALPMEWRLHAAPPVTANGANADRMASAVEVLKTMRYFVWARWTERCEP